MAGGARSQPRWRGLPVAGAILVGVSTAGFATKGPAGGLAIAGLLAVLVGLAAASLGHSRWALIGSRRVAAVVALAGVVAFVVGAVVEARTAQGADPSSFSSEQSAHA